MKLLLDENLSPTQAAFLRFLGYDAIAVLDAGLAGEPDEVVRAYGIESGRILVTLDSDFSNILRFPPSGTPGVLRLKIHPATEEAIRQLLQRTLFALRDTSLEGCLAVCHRDIIRIRR